MNKQNLLSLLQRVSLVLFLVSVVVPSWSATSSSQSTSSVPTSSKLRVTFLNVGQGDSILIRTKEKNILIDAGNDIDNSANGVIIPYFQKEGIKKIDVAVITHPHRDHFGGFLDLVQAIPIGEFLYSTDTMPKTADDPASKPGDDVHYQKLFQLIHDKQIPAHDVKVGDTFDWGSQVHVDLLHCAMSGDVISPAPGYKIGPNDLSLVFKVTADQISYIFTGDAEAASEDQMMKDFPGKMSCTVLKSGHHGSKTASSMSFLEAAKPKFVVISVGLNNEYHLPSPVVLQNYATCNIKIYRTDQDGTVDSTSDGKTVNFSSSQSPAVLVQHLKEIETSGSPNESEVSAMRREAVSELAFQSLISELDTGNSDSVKDALNSSVGTSAEPLKKALKEKLMFKYTHSETTEAEREVLKTFKPSL
ncbi:MAG: MBL fold metallo-hydrolase [Candidatus Riflebacteria bacterium]|nr:MBL fold metallo-hydrolase [Candidatus Riflebacteria bacterium]